MLRSKTTWMLMVACGLFAVAVILGVRTWSPKAAGVEATPERVSAGRPRDSKPTQLAAVEPAIEEQRIEETAPPPPIAPPAESVKAKLERLTPDAHLTPIGTPITDAQGEVDRIEHLIYEATKEEFEYRFAQRIGLETLSIDPNFKYTGEGYDPKAVYWVRFTPGGPTEKVTLPKDEFPEIYELKAQSAMLRLLLDHPGLADADLIEDR